MEAEIESGDTLTSTEAPRSVRLKAFVRLGRPRFLLQSAAALGLGMLAADHDGHPLSLGWYAVGIALAWTSHLMVHYCNEYFDLPADRANSSHTQWTGGSRVLVEGLVKPETSLSSAFVLVFAAFFIISAVPDVVVREFVVLLLALAWFYTAPPFRLNYHGLGELTSGICLYGLVPILSYYFYAGSVSGLLLSIVIPILCVQVLRQFIMNLSDIEGDRKTNKRTAAVVLGPNMIVRLYTGGQVLCYLALAVLGIVGALPLPVTVAMLLTAALPAWVGWKLLTGGMEKPSVANRITFLASIQLPSMVCAAMTGLVIHTLLDQDQPAWNNGLTVYAITMAIYLIWVFGLIVGVRPATGATQDEQAS
ncbi:prenyltransferase [Nocardia altamirensis]|uniref:prenyltransferase n=1 Tax=Nocardia altamirensis TaxID=472158 RepID=UPI00083FF089|nr:prenyltransferase [Nocardia altamirensis]